MVKAVRSAMPAVRSYVANASTYGRYVAVGAIVGGITIALRGAVSAVLAGDTPVYYSISVVLAYAAGIVLSYYGHRHFTFGHRELANGTGRRFSQFTAIAVLGLIGTAVLSVGVRYGCGVDRIFGPYGADFAFVVGTFLASLLTYTLNSLYTFCASHRRPDAREATGHIACVPDSVGRPP